MAMTGDTLQPSSDSFYDIDSYKRTVRRHEDGLRLCNDLMQLIQERADIEKHYAKSLKGWAKKWDESIDKGPEYGSTEAAWKSTLTEATELADIHLRVRDNLINEVQASVKTWRGDHYHKPMVGPCKEAKSLEDDFKKVQKPWAKRLSKVHETKKKYHTTCKLEKTATIQEKNARGDTSMSEDQVKKLQEKVEKLRKEIVITKDRYVTSLSDLNAYNAKYKEDMTRVFMRSQEMEDKRLRYFKEMLFGMHKYLNLSKSDQMVAVYDQLRASLGQADAAKDLKWWSCSYGADMTMQWPVFQEYSQEFRHISRKEKKNGITGGDGVTMTSIKKSETTVVPDVESTQNPLGDEDDEDLNDATRRSSVADDVSTGTEQDNEELHAINEATSF